MDATLEATAITAAVTVFVALIGYFISYFNNIRLAQRTEKLQRIDRQLSELYGPLYAVVDTGDRVWKAFGEKHWSWITRLNSAQLTESELQEWRRWVTTVFMPSNRQLVELIRTKSDLIIESDIPPCLKDLCAHVAGYEIVLERWEQNEFSELVSIVGYPTEDLKQYTAQSFKDLKYKQAKILGELKRNRSEEKIRA
jgi:hypothetical protein